MSEVLHLVTFLLILKIKEIQRNHDEFNTSSKFYLKLKALKLESSKYIMK